MSNHIFINNIHRGVKKSFRFKFTKNVNKNTIIKVIECAIAEYNANIDSNTANASLIAAVIAKEEADKAIVMVDKFLAVTSKNDENYRIAFVRLKALEAIAIHTAKNAAKTNAIAKTAMLALEANIAMSSDIVVNSKPNTNEY